LCCPWVTALAGWNFRGGRRWNDLRFLSVVSAMLESTSGVYIELVEPVVPLDGEERPPVPDVYAAELAFAAATVRLSWNIHCCDSQYCWG